MPFLELDKNMIGLVADDKPLGEPGEGVTRMRLGSDGGLRTRIKGGEEVVVGGKSLSDYSDVIVVDVNGSGDFTTLSEALAVANTGALIIVFSSTGTQTATVTKNITILAPNKSTSITIALTINTGGFLTLTGPGNLVSSGISITLNAGTLRSVGAQIGGQVDVNGGTVESFAGSTFSSLNFQNTANFRLLNTRFTASLGFGIVMPASPSNRVVMGCWIDTLSSDQAWSNFPMYHSTMIYPPEGLTVAAGNYSNISEGLTWPAIP